MMLETSQAARAHLVVDAFQTCRALRYTTPGFRPSARLALASRPLAPALRALAGSLCSNPAALQTLLLG